MKRFYGLFFILLGSFFIFAFNSQKSSDTPSAVPPCDSNVIYFEKDILPILNSNCALSGCHSEESRKHGIILSSYDNAVSTTRIRPERPLKSEIYKKITEDDHDDRMPPPPKDPLSAHQIRLIGLWLEQGALNLKCDEVKTGCGESPVSFKNDVMPVIEKNCMGCHDTDNPKGIFFTSHGEIKKAASSGALYGAITHSEGFKKMPRGAPKLEDCDIKVIKRWIDDGMKDN